MGSVGAVAVYSPLSKESWAVRAIEGKKLWNVHTVATSDRAWVGLFSLLCISRNRTYSNCYIPKSSSK